MRYVCTQGVHVQGQHKYMPGVLSTTVHSALTTNPLPPPGLLIVKAVAQVGESNGNSVQQAFSYALA